MKDFSINEMQAMQKQLQDKYSAIWEPINTSTGQNKLLWMVEEIGEVAHIIKKNGGEKATADGEIRKKLVEELADVLMCYGISAEELKSAYEEKFKTNMTRW